ncbi:hypothetical protein [Streptomyces sp. NEAU-H3]|uniref:hypothetical protein n=1 Tax=Streptomyces sp. NEAU-H3 TaxID=2720636 RepID=UPI001439FB6B|nr:hypothetical protein [Streptomyces sp. NEAU-H3]NJA59174.1 hypothetical protein [Streptomyces sp. NEAU-H3]
MRRPTHRRPNPTAWSHPYTGVGALAVFYNDGGDPAPVPKPAAPPTPADPAPAQVTMSQEDLQKLAAKEKDQGRRSGAKAALEEFAREHGFANVDDAKTFITAAREAKEAALTEQEKREQALAQREAELAAREQTAIARERIANRRALLAGLGATGDDLDDAVSLLRAEDDADDQALTEAAAALKARRPELCGNTTTAPPVTPAAPTGLPAPGMPRPGGTQPKPGERGLEMLRRRGKTTAPAA